MLYKQQPNQAPLRRAALFIIAKLKTTHFGVWLELVNIAIGDKKPRALARVVSCLHKVNGDYYAIKSIIPQVVV